MRLRRDPDFAKLLGGQVVSEFGSVVSWTAIPIAAVLVLGASPFQLAGIVIANSVGVTLTSLAAGAWTDRLPRRRLMIAADFGRAIVLATLPLAAFAGTLRIELLYVVAFVNAVLGTFFEVAYRSYLPSLVGQDALLDANSALDAGAESAWIVAPTIAGALVQAVSAPVTILVDALSFVASALSILWIRKPEPVRASAERRSLRREIAEGVGIVWREPSLRALFGYTLAGRLFGSFFAALYTIYALQELHVSPLLLGIAVSAGGVAGVIGSIAGAPFARRYGMATAVLWGGGVLGTIAYLPLPFAFGPPLLALGFLLFQQLLGDFWGAVAGVATTTLRQTLAPEHALGRVNSLQYLFVAGVASLGAVIGAAIAEWYGIRAAVLLAVVGSGLSLVFLVASPIRRMNAHRPISTAVAEATA